MIGGKKVTEIEEQKNIYDKNIYDKNATEVMLRTKLKTPIVVEWSIFEVIYLKYDFKKEQYVINSDNNNINDIIILILNNLDNISSKSGRFEKIETKVKNIETDEISHYVKINDRYSDTSSVRYRLEDINNNVINKYIKVLHALDRYGNISYKKR
jgi:hypothetical protein